MKKKPNQLACSKSARKIVLTGGPGVGKTSILKNLGRLKHEIREEVFTRIFAEAQSSGRFNDDFLHSPELVHELITAQKKLESLPCSKDYVFLDRCRIDILGFSRMMQINLQTEHKDELMRGDYTLFFLIEPMPKKFYDQNSVRRQDYDESLEHHARVAESYAEYLLERGQDPETHLVKVPFFDMGFEESIQKRTHFILNEIKARVPA